jgi:polyisoprenoid-binding protein YceI
MKRKILVLPMLAAMLVLLLSACSASPAATAEPSPAVNTQQPLPTATSPAATAPAATQPAAAPEPSPTGAAVSGGEIPSSGAAGGMQFTLVEGKNEARYRVREQLANRDLPNDAIGKTNQVSGAITILPDGSVDKANSKFTVDVSTLATDQSMRDNYVRRSILQTSQYQYVTFVPTSVTGLPNPLPTSGTVDFQLTGDLTIRDVTKSVTWQVKGTVDGGAASGTAVTSFTFAEFNLPQPKVPIVLGVEDKITLELDLTIQSAKP